MQNATGAVMAPLESFLCSRGLKTLELRVREHCRTAARIAEYLASDRRVRRVLYPGLADHPGHALAARQMDGGFGAMLSLRGRRRFRGRQAGLREHAAVSTGRQPGRGRIAHRAAGRDVARQLRPRRPRWPSASPTA